MLSSDRAIDAPIDRADTDENPSFYEHHEEFGSSLQERVTSSDEDSN